MSATTELREYVDLLGYKYTDSQIIDALKRALADAIHEAS